jgi:hypothetical protein
MKKNVGGFDRVFRFILGVGLLSIVVIGPKTLWGLIGAIPLITSLFSFCPLYTLVGMNSCTLKSE